jgi:hypothetical protein
MFFCIYLNQEGYGFQNIVALYLNFGLIFSHNLIIQDQRTYIHEVILDLITTIHCKFFTREHGLIYFLCFFVIETTSVLDYMPTIYCQVLAYKLSAYAITSLLINKF